MLLFVGANHTHDLSAAASFFWEVCRVRLHSRKDARKALADIAKAKSYASGVLGLEESEGSCLAHQLGHCKGACVGKQLKNRTPCGGTRFLSLKFKAWPFPGRVALIERGPMGSLIRMF